jgi:hypothetical protein
MDVERGSSGPIEACPRLVHEHSRGRGARLRGPSLGLAVGLLFGGSLLGCSGGGGAGPASSGPASATVSASGQALAPLPPERSLESMLDPDAALALEVAKPEALVAALESTLAKADPSAFETMLGGAARSLGVGAAPLRGLLAATTEAGFYLSEGQGVTKAALVLRVRSDKDALAVLREKPVNTARSTALFEVHGEGEVELVAYAASQRLLVVGTAPALVDLEARIRAGGGTHRELTLAKGLLGGAAGVAVVGKLAGLAKADAELAPILGGSTVRAGVRVEGGALRTTIELRDVSLPGLALLASPSPLTLPDSLPEGTVGYVALSLARSPAGKSARALAEAFSPLKSRASVERGVAELEAAAKRFLGVPLDTALGWLGDELVVAVPSFVAAQKLLSGGLDDADPGLLVEVKLTEEAGPIAALAALEAAIKAENKAAKVTRKGGLLRVEAAPSAPKKGAPRQVAELSIEGGRARLLLGSAEAVKELSLRISKGGKLGADPAHAALVKLLPASARLRASFDASAMARVVPAFVGMPRLGVALSITQEGERSHLRLDDSSGALGALAALSIYGVRRYIASAKTAEAKNTIGAISRGAVAAFEREALAPDGSTAVHALCKSAKPVPAQVQRASKHMPSSSPGQDFETGSATEGWRCLKFTMTSPFYYQYDYRTAPPFKGPARGGPDPGPGGFEVSAEGDLDGDGKTSLFTRVGRLDAKKQLLTLSDLFVSDEHE